MKFLIWSPPLSRSAGVQTLHRLTHLLNKAGFEAYITTEQSNPDYIAPFKAHPDDDTIVIYPEIAMGSNHLKAKRFIGWMLNRPGALGGDRIYQNGTKVFVYHEKFREATEKAIGENVPDRRLFGLGLIEPRYFYDDGNRERDLNALWIYKGGAIRNLYKFENEDKLLSLDDMNLNLKDLGDLLRRVKCLYSYDRESQLNTMALVCGCEVFTKSDQGLTVPYVEDADEIARFIADDEKDVERVRHFGNMIMEDFQMKNKGSEFFVAVYTNECKLYAEKPFFTRLKELTDKAPGAEIHVVDNSLGDEYYNHLVELIRDLGFTVPIKVEHIDVDRTDRKSLFQRNVSESLAVLRDAFLESKKDYFVIVESDIIPKCDDLFDRFLDVADKADIIGGIYYGGFHDPLAFLPDTTGLHKTGHALSGCTLYKRRVIKALPFRYSPDTLGAFPDALMSFDAGQKGFKIADSWAIKCDHLGTPDGSRGQSALR